MDMRLQINRDNNFLQINNLGPLARNLLWFDRAIDICQ